MKTLLIIAIVFICGSLKLSAQSSDTLKNKYHCYYYLWSFNALGGSGWGENHVCLDHKPTVKEVLIMIKALFYKDRYFKYVKVDIVMNSNSPMCICPSDTVIVKKPF